MTNKKLSLAERASKEGAGYKRMKPNRLEGIKNLDKPVKNNTEH